MGQNMGTLGGSKSGSFEVGKKVGILHLDRIGGIFLSWGKKMLQVLSKLSAAAAYDRRILLVIVQ